MPKPKALPNAREITKLGWQRWRLHSPTTTIVALVATAVSFALLNLSEAASFTAEIWFVVVLSVLVWFYGLPKRKKLPGVGTMFYEGSTAFLRHLLVFMVWIIYLIPFVTGAVLVQYVNSYQFAASSAEIIGFNTIWIMLGLLSLYLLLRGWLAPLYVGSGLRPVAALKSSWSFSRRRFSWMARAVALPVLVAIIPLSILFAFSFTPWFVHEIVQLVFIVLLYFLLYVFTLPLLVASSYEIKRYEPKKSAIN